ncbi:MAG TPA: O-antigen ligase family protein [Roseiflexaceae bacterium]|nr:O-antigen ligase family protein [Roseiflexaceae bacterium]
MRIAQTRAGGRWPWLRSDWPALLGIAVGLGLFSRVEALPVRLPALLLFGLLALARPHLMLLFVPLTMPMYLIGVLMLGLRASETRLPLHEIALLCALAGTLMHIAWGWLSGWRAGERPRFALTAAALRRFAPHALFLLAGVVGLLLAVERRPALIEFRRIIAEPLIFYALLLWHTKNQEPIEVRSKKAEGRSNESEAKKPASNTFLTSYFLLPPLKSLITYQVIHAFILGGVLAAAIGLLQVVGLDLIWMFGDKATVGRAENVVSDGSLVRATSFYGHPNNLGLALGRVWPLAAVLALAAWRGLLPRRLAWLYGLAALLCLAGIAVSVSRGAWLGALAAAAVLVGQQLARNTRHPRLPWLLGLGAGLVVVVGLVLTLRGGPAGGSGAVRLLIWREALLLIQQHPLGLGLDQFLYYHDPQYGRSLIDPSLIGTSEQFAAHPHNLLLDAWLRVGPLGVLALGWLVARYLRAGLRALRDPAALPALVALGALAALAAALVHGLVDNFYFVTDLALAFWLLLAVVERLEAGGKEPRTVPIAETLRA